MTAARTSPPRARPFALIAAIQFLCASFFAADIGFELHNDLVNDRPLGRVALVHLVAESLATLLLVVGYVLSHRQFLHLQRIERQSSQTLRSLRGQFDDILTERFLAWGLSRAESDIALLSLRGLKIAEIAELRHTREGTIKSQLSAIFRKAGVSTRAELLAFFMDEFLDFGAATTAAPPATGPHPARLNPPDAP